MSWQASIRVRGTQDSTSTIHSEAYSPPFPGNTSTCCVRVSLLSGIRDRSHSSWRPPALELALQPCAATFFCACAHEGLPRLNVGVQLAIQFRAGHIRKRQDARVRNQQDARIRNRQGVRILPVRCLSTCYVLRTGCIIVQQHDHRNTRSVKCRRCVVFFAHRLPLTHRLFEFRVPTLHWFRPSRLLLSLVPRPCGWIIAVVGPPVRYAGAQNCVLTYVCKTTFARTAYLPVPGALFPVPV